MRISSETLPPAPVTRQGGGTVFTLRPSLPGSRIDGSMPVWRAPQTARDEVIQNLALPQEAKPNPALSLAEEADGRNSADKSFGFFDLVDMINPLQHIPIVSTIYRTVTGDTIKPVAQIIGGAAFGGVLGAASGIANAIVTEATGADIGQNIINLAMGDTYPKDPHDTTIAVTNLSYRQPRYNE